MKYPLVPEYINSIMLAQDNFSELKYLRPIVKSDGTPVYIKGDNSVVFKMRDSDTGKLYAIKCFTRDQDNRDTSYKLITDQLKEINSSYIISIQYFEKELLVNSEEARETRFPVLLIDWVEGVTLNKYLNLNIDNQRALCILTYRFGQLAQWLLSQPFAHGNIDLDNIIIKDDDSLVLIDYDGMYVPNMKGQKAREEISPFFRHPLCEFGDYDENIDDFPLISILLSLKVISQKPYLFRDRIDINQMLFTETDFNDLTKSRLYLEYVQKQLNDKDICILNGLFLLAYSQMPLKGITFELSKPLSTSISDEDWEEAKREGKGWFSKDGKRFYGIYNPKSRNEDYQLLQLMGGSVVLDGDETEVICDYALSHVSRYTEIVFPDKLETIGYNVFEDVNQIDRINFPKSLKNICGNPFEGVIIDEINNLSSQFVVNGSAIYSSQQKMLISYYSKKEVFKIGNPTEEIGERAFASNNYIKHVIISDGITKIGKGAFANCPTLEVIDLPKSLRTIEDEAFLHICIDPDIPIAQQEEKESFKKYCDINSLTIPYGVNKIGRKAFLGIKTIKNESSYFKIVDDALLSADGNELICYFGKKANYIIPQGVSIVYSCAFMNNQHLKTISIPETVTIVEEYAFANCSKLTKVTFKGKHTQIERGVFSCCSVLKDVRLPRLLSVISNETFQHCSSITDFTFPSNLSIIGESAFYACKSLTNLVIPDNVISIGKSAFDSCAKIKELKLPKQLKIIEEETFKDCGELVSIHFPDELEEITSYAFYGCKSIVEIKLPLNLKRIGYWAFCSCNALENCYLSNPNTQIDEKAFDCLGYDKFKLFLPKGANINDFVKVMPMSVHGYTYYADGDYLPNFSHQYENIVPYIEDIPLEDILSDNEDTHWSYVDKYYRDEKGGVYTNGKQCFHGIDEEIACKEKKYVVANGTKYICNRAFVTENHDIYNKCPFEEIILPDSICAIGAKAFMGTSINNLKLPTSLTYIGDFAFKNCHNLCSVLLPASVEKLGRNPFVNTEKLTSICTESQAFKITGNCLLDINTGNLIHCYQKRIIKKVVGEGWFTHVEYEKSICKVPHEVKSIGECSFANAEVDTVIIPTSVLEIKDEAFEGNRYLNNIHIPDSVAFIGIRAFRDCIGLTDVHLSCLIETINDYVFEGCTKLESIVIPDGVKRIGNFAFSGCSSIKNIQLPKSIKEIGVNPFVGSGIEYINNCSEAFEIDNKILYTKNKLRLISCFSKEKEIVLPDGIEMVDEYAFKDCCSVEKVYIPSSVKKLGKHAFEGCTSLIKVEIESTNLSSLQEYTFLGCKKLIDIHMPDSISEIGRGVFNNCSSIKSLRLPKGLKKIDDWNFQNCPSLETIWLPFGVKKETLPWKFRGKGKEMSLEDCGVWLDDKGVAYSSDKKELIKGESSLTEYSILDGTEVISDNAFNGCLRLKHISIPSSVQEIKNGAFNICGVEELILPNSIIKLGNSIFGGVNGFNPLEKIVIPPSVEEMDGNPFAGYALKVYNESNHFMIINDVIYTSDLKKIISCLAVGKEILRIADIVKVIGKYAFASCNLKEIIVPDSVEEIDEFAFYGSSLKAISIPETISVINEGTFQRCGLKNVVLPQSIKELKRRSFCDCFALESITIPSSVILIGDSAFGACRSLEKVTILGCNAKISISSFRYCDKLREIVVPKGCKERFVSMLSDNKFIIREDR